MQSNILNGHFATDVIVQFQENAYTRWKKNQNKEHENISFCFDVCH